VSNPEPSGSRASRAFGIASLILGILALAADLAYEVARADLGADLGIASRGFRALFHLGSVVLAGVGIALALAAAATGSTVRSRLGAALPGLLSSGAALSWFALKS
jgi:hypothetical protein